LGTLPGFSFTNGGTNKSKRVIDEEEVSAKEKERKKKKQDFGRIEDQRCAVDREFVWGERQRDHVERIKKAGGWETKDWCNHLGKGCGKKIARRRTHLEGHGANKRRGKSKDPRRPNKKLIHVCAGKARNKQETDGKSRLGAPGPVRREGR